MLALKKLIIQVTDLKVGDLIITYLFGKVMEDVRAGKEVKTRSQGNKASGRDTYPKSLQGYHDYHDRYESLELTVTFEETEITVSMDSRKNTTIVYINHTVFDMSADENVGRGIKGVNLNCYVLENFFKTTVLEQLSDLERQVLAAIEGAINTHSGNN